MPQPNKITYELLIQLGGIETNLSNQELASLNLPKEWELRKSFRIGRNWLLSHVVVPKAILGCDNDFWASAGVYYITDFELLLNAVNFKGHDDGMEVVRSQMKEAIGL